VDIVFLTHRLPYPPNKGDKIRSHALLAHLAHNHRVHLACFVDDASDWAHVETVRNLARGECLFVPLPAWSKWTRAAFGVFGGQSVTEACFGGKRIQNWLNTVAAKYGIERAVVFSSAVASFVLNGSAIDPARAILDMVDVDSEKWRQYAASSRGLAAWIYRREVGKVATLEDRAVSTFAATLLSSPDEAHTLIKRVPGRASNIFVLNNGVDLELFSPGDFKNPYRHGEDSIVMTGRMDYKPNVDGAIWFASEVMPRLKRELPNGRFYVVGASPSPSLRALSNADVVVTGYVTDVRPYLAHAAAVVAPLRIARGVQNKVLEAMAMAKPVVATPEATRALAVDPRTELWIATDAADFAQAVLAAAKGIHRAEFGGNARRYVEARHNWQENLAIIDQLLSGQELLSSSSLPFKNHEKPDALSNRVVPKLNPLGAN
jgi:polysaccharide biosynthesis protein PslH